MPISDDYLNYITDLLQCVGATTSKKMFGGVGIYLRGVIFALIADDTLYFKVDNSNRQDYDAQGMCPFRPFGRKSYTMQYYEVPIDVLEDSEKLKKWANKALTAAKNKKKEKKRDKLF